MRFFSGLSLAWFVSRGGFPFSRRRGGSGAATPKSEPRIDLLTFVLFMAETGTLLDALVDTPPEEEDIEIFYEF